MSRKHRGDCDFAWERTLTAVTQENIYYSYFFGLFCRLFWIFFSFSPSPIAAVNFISTKKSN